MSTDLARRVADELDIRNLIARLAILADEGDLGEYISLFTDDAVWEMRNKAPNGATFPPKKGHAEILAGSKERRAAGIQGPGTHTRHTLFQTALELEGDSASARSYMALYRNTDKVPEPAVFVTYADEFRRTATGWKLSKRVIEPA